MTFIKLTDMTGDIMMVKASDITAYREIDKETRVCLHNYAFNVQESLEEIKKLIEAATPAPIPAPYIPYRSPWWDDEYRRRQPPMYDYKNVPTWILQPSTITCNCDNKKGNTE